MLTERELLGLDDSHVETGVDGVALHPDCRCALEELQSAASAAGFDLRIASGYRSFERQLLIWNAKIRGERPLHDDAGRPLLAAELGERELLQAVLRFSALPGSSRHHWGSDLDVFDAAAVPADYRVQLSPLEVSPEGVFAPFHDWLDERIASGEACGFVRPYGEDRGGVAPERWHLSYTPLSLSCERACTVELLRSALENADLALSGLVLAQLDEIYRRYIVIPTQS
jgi:LAS superfamily LD-carboxypeptidase LdcB